MKMFLRIFTVISRRTLLALLLLFVPTQAWATYNPATGRFLNRDPIGEEGGSNVYGFCLNNPVSNVDPLGLSVPTDDGTGRYVGNDGKMHDPTPWADPQGVRPPQPTSFTGYSLLFDFLAGKGDTVRNYGQNSPEVRNLQQSAKVQQMRDQFYLDGCKGENNISYSTLGAFWDTIIVAGNPFNTGGQVGGFAGASVTNNGNGTMAFHITNDAGTYSFFLHAVPNRTGTTGPLRTITQNFDWIEPIEARKCSCLLRK